MSEVMSIVLLGKTGYGKSATGNTLLSLYRFEESNNSMSQTKTVIDFSVEYEGKRLRVYDTRGLMDVESDDNKPLALKQFYEDISRLLQITDERQESITVFLLVFDATNKFTAEDREAMKIVESMFGGDDFFQKFCIVVMTKEDILDVNFEEWIGKQKTSELGHLIRKCQNRVVPACNKAEEKRTASRQKLISAIMNLKHRSKAGYTNAEYLRHALKRQALLLEYELPNLKALYDQKLSEIKNDRINVKSREQREKLIKKIAILKDQIEEKDARTNKLCSYITELQTEEYLIPKKFCSIQ